MRRQTGGVVDSADGGADLWIGHVKLISSKGRDIGLDASSPQGYNVQRAIQCKVLNPVGRIAFVGWLQPWYPCTQCQGHHALHSIYHAFCDVTSIKIASMMKT